MERTVVELKTRQLIIVSKAESSPGVEDEPGVMSSRLQRLMSHVLQERKACILLIWAAHQ